MLVVWRRTHMSTCAANGAGMARLIDHARRRLCGGKPTKTTVSTEAVA